MHEGSVKVAILSQLAAGCASTKSLHACKDISWFGNLPGEFLSFVLIAGK